MVREFEYGIKAHKSIRGGCTMKKWMAWNIVICSLVLSVFRKRKKKQSPRLYPRPPAATVVVTWWRHQMETFLALLGLYVRNSLVIGEFPHKGQWRGALTFPVICVSTNGWINNRDAGDLRRHRAHYDVTVIVLRITKSCSQQAHSHHHHLPASVSDYFQLVFSKTYRMNSEHTLKIILTYHSKQLNSVGSSRYRGELN